MNKTKIWIVFIILNWSFSAWALAISPVHPSEGFATELHSPKLTQQDIPDTSIDTYKKVYLKNPALAREYLRSLRSNQTKDAELQKEIAYALLDQHKDLEALPHFELAEQLHPSDYEIKMEIGYIYDDLYGPTPSIMDQKAFSEYKAVAEGSSDPQLVLTAKQAMVDIAGAQTQFLPYPYFSDLYFSPYYLPRWPDTIFPAIFRVGRNFYEGQMQLYGIIYSNQDTNSNVGNVIGDNSVVFDAGMSIFPWKNFPLYLYIEAGDGYNIIPDEESNNTQWTPDLRGGIDLFLAWGDTAHYAEKLRFPFKQVGDLYLDFSYFSRYSDDWIGQVIVHEGLRVLEYKYTSVDVYWKVNYLVDTQRLYYNNLIETGPGISITPYNLWHINFSLDFAKGFYLPVTSAVTNPYGSTYNANMFTLEMYFSF